MVSTVTIDGTTFTLSQFEGYGYIPSILALAQAQVNVADDVATDAATSVGGTGTSASSVTIGTGTKNFVTQANKGFTSGRWLTISSAANPANYMFGQVTSYSGTSLQMNITAIGGSGTFADWNIAVSGIQGVAGSISDGDKGDITVSSGGTVWTIDNAVVTLAKLAAEAKRFWTSTVIEAPADGDYKLIDSSPAAYTVRNVRSICTAGTATATSKINSTALGGTANAVSTTAQVQNHTTNNSIAVGDNLNVTLSSVSGAANITLFYELELV